jgi:hypothetical protein
LTSELRLQRQPCNKADDKIITGPLKSELPDVKCAPNGETLETVRAAPGVPQSILGVTGVADSKLAYRFEELPASKCRVIIESAFALRLEPFMYIKAGKYADGIEQTPNGRPCPAGKRIPRTLLVTPPMAAKFKEGEIEHCEDHKLAFALSQGKYNQAMKDLAAEDYCPGGPPSAEGPDCHGEFKKRFKERTGIDFSDQFTIAQCLHGKSGLRDANHWHDVKESTYDVAYAADCKSVTYIPDPDAVPEISLEKHPPSSIIKGCGEK